MSEEHNFDRRTVLEPEKIDDENTRAGLAVVHVDQGEDMPPAISFENFHRDEDGEVVPTRAALAPYPDGLLALKELKELYEEFKEAKAELDEE